LARYLINFSYDGSNYNGYQKQKGLNTIQGKLEDALKYINNNEITRIHSSGRTDAHVHAYNQYGHTDINVNITEYKLKCALNSLLPDDIYVKSTKKVSDDFHARYMVKSKEYIYKINLSEYNPIEKNYVYQYCKKLDVKKMQEAIKYFIGKHDFTTYSSNQDRKENNIRIIYDAEIIEKDNYLYINFVGTGFLKYMVRIMVGALIMVGTDKIKPIDINNYFDKKDKSLIKVTAPAEGLYLNNVTY
jgi:tRNA pseudouridine38-40 synthase